MAYNNGRPKDGSKTKVLEALQEFRLGRPFERVINKKLGKYVITATGLERPDSLPMRNCGGSMSRVILTGTVAEALHTIAHDMTFESHGVTVAEHGPEFTRCYLRLVKRYMGNDAYQDLRSIYKERKIKHRVISPEAREKRKQMWVERNAPTSASNLQSMIEKLDNMD